MRYRSTHGRTIESLEQRTFLAAADLDAAFGYMGIRNIPVTPNRGDELQDIATDAGSRILTVATEVPRSFDEPSTLKSIVSRFTAGGQLDPTFGNGGRVVIPFDGIGSELHQIASGPNGTVTLAGADFERDALVLYRLTATGAVDTSFGGGDGLVVVPDSAFVSELLVRPDGSTIVFSLSATSTASRISAFTADGQVDSSFGDAGVLEVGSFRIAQDSGSAARAGDGSILVAGTSSNRVSIAKLTATGQLDLTFGGDGIVEGTTGVGHAITIDSSNRLIVGGSVRGDDNDFGVWRFSATGVQDMAFGGGDGVFSHDFEGYDAGYSQDMARFVAQLPGGDIVVAGYSAGPRKLNAALQISDAGALATDIGNGGIYERRRPGDMYVLSAQNTLIAADSDAPFGQIITRFGATGNIDATFGVGGSFYVDTSGQLPTIRKILPLSSGKFLAAGNTRTLDGGEDFYVGRFNSNGTYDTTFGGGDGFVTINFDTTQFFFELASNLLRLANGKLLVFGTSGKIARLSADGVLDTTFGTGGKLRHERFSGIVSAAEQNDGKIILAGEAFVNMESFAVARILANGAVDTSFGQAGYFEKSQFFNSDELSESAGAFAVAVRPNGKIVAAGAAYLDSRPAPVLLQLTSGGQLDTSFNQGKGFNLLRTGTMFRSGGFADLHLYADGKVVAAGGFGTTALVAKFKSDGTLDSSFATKGAAEFAFSRAVENFGFQTLFVQQDGKLLLTSTGVAEDAARFSRLYRLSSSGAPDTTFGPGGIIETSSGSLSTMTDAAVVSDGRIIVAGATDDDLRGAGTAFAALLNGKSSSAPRIVLQNNGTLVVLGTAGFDNIKITRSGSNIIAQLNNTTATFNSSSVKRLLLLGDQQGDVMSNTISLPATIYAGAGDDALYGGIRNESFYGGGGDDTLDGGLGDDWLDGESGINRASYAKRAVPVTVNLSEQFATIGTESDTLRAILQAEGGSAGDTLIAEGRTTLYGNGGNDVMSGGEGDTEFVLYGGNGNDTLSDSGGESTLVGEAGNDRLIGNESILSYETHTAGVNAQLNETINVGGGEVDTLAGTFIGIIGSTGNDTLVLAGPRLSPFIFSNRNGLVRGLSGNDTLTGSNTRDSLFGGNGDDQITAGSDDIAFGDAGNDTLTGSTGRETLHGDDGNDLIDAGAGNDVGRGGFGNDTVIGGSGNDFLTGDEGNDTVSGGSENDTLFGGTGDDQLVGSSGNDSLDGEAGNDELLAGAGNDRMFSSAGADRFVGSGGVDEVNYSDRSDNLRLSLNNVNDDGATGEGDNIGADIEQITGGSGNDRIIGNGLANTLIGGDGKDTIYGGGGDDFLDGGSARDLLYGQDGNDRLDGGPGADIIDGGNGIDSLLGGADGGDEITNVEIL